MNTIYAILEIVPGTIESGWQANLIISNQNNEVIRDTRGWFSEAIALQQAYNQWENNYFSWGTGNRWLRRRPVPPDILITNYATIDDCQNSALELVEELNKWLKNSTLEDIKLALIKYANPEFVSVKLVIRTDDPFLQKLPWHRSHFFRTNYLHHNISFTMSRGCKICKLKSPVKILTILGSDENIEIESDLEMIKTSLGSTASIDVLRQPGRRDFFRKLREKPWDTMFFAGHSETNESNTGFIYLNSRERLSFDELQDTLQERISQHLQLIIINSCQGVGLAHQLLEIGIPNVLVMAQPIHDRVAQKFLEEFLKHFAQEKLALDDALQQARHILAEQMEENSPNASWMPLLFQRGEIQPSIYYPSSSIWEKIKDIIGGFRPKKPFFLPFLSLIALLLAIFVHQFSIQDKLTCDSLTQEDTLLSCGEKTLMGYNTQGKDDNKRNGIEAFQNRNYGEAAQLFDQVENDPEALVFKNNSHILDGLKQGKIKQQDVLPIAVVLPIPLAQEQNNTTLPPYKAAKYSLQGISYFQENFNKNTKDNHYKQILIILANDENKPNSTGKIVAQELTKRELYGVVGHYSSRSVGYAYPDYNNNEIVTVSYSNNATFVRIKDKPKNIELSHSTFPYFYRVTSTDVQQTELLVSYLKDYFKDKDQEISNQEIGKVIIFYSPGKFFSESFVEQFKAKWGATNILDNPIALNSKELTDDYIINKIQTIKNEHKKIAILLAPDAWQGSYEQKNTANILNIILNNNDDVLIGGNNVISLYPEAQSPKNLVVATHWVPFYNKQLGNIHDELTSIMEMIKQWKINLDSLEAHEQMMRAGLAHDALLVLADSLKSLDKPTGGSKLKNYIDNHIFNGITGEFSFQGSDRQDNIAALIKPYCENNNKCHWRRIK